MQVNGELFSTKRSLARVVKRGKKVGFILIWVLLSGSIKSWILLVRNRHQFLIGYCEKPKSAVLKKVPR